MTLNEFIEEFNSQLTGKVLSELEQQEIFRLASNLFRNRYCESPNFDVDETGRIYLLENESEE